MIRGYLRVHPGDTYSDLKRNLMVSTGVLIYHLKVLEREGLIKSQVRGRRVHYYPKDVPMPENGGGLHELQLRILQAIEEKPGISTRDVAGTFGVSVELIGYHIRALNAEGLVRVARPRMWPFNALLYPR